MLPSFGAPIRTVGPQTSSSIRTGSTSRPPASSDTRNRARKPSVVPGCATTLSAQPTRKSLDGIKAPEHLLRPLHDESAAAGVQSLPPGSSGTPASSELHSLSHSVSAASLNSESDLALLLGGGDADDSATPLVFGSFPPVLVAANVATSPAAAVEDETPATATPAAAAASTTKLKPTSHEFIPQAYLAAATAALAARTISSSIARSASPSPAAAVVVEEEVEQTEAVEPATAAVVVESIAAAQDETQQSVAATATEEVEAAPQAVCAAAADGGVDTTTQQQQQQWAMVQHQQQQQQQQHPMTEQQWHVQQQQQYWHYWRQQQQQQPHQAQQQQMVPVPVLVPVYVQPYPYGPQHHYVQQQHPQMHMAYVMPAAAAADHTAAAAPGPQQHQQQHEYYYNQQQQHYNHHMQQQQVVCPPSPGGYSVLPADTCSLMSATTPAATPTWAQNAGMMMAGGPYSSYGSRPGSSAGSVISTFSSVSRRQRQQQFGEREVTVSAMSCVKDAAGALAKVVTRHNNCLLLSLAKPGDAVAQATHVAAKSLAVARFYVQAHMNAAGAAGIDAAAALTGVEQQQQAAEASAPADAGDAAGSVSAADASVDDEVVFMPYQRSSSSSSGSRRPSIDTADMPLGFMVAKASARDLPVLLPPPVGIPACMQDRVQQQGQQQQQQQRASAAATGNVVASASSSNTTLLKAGANTDVNKLSNAVIHNILGSGHVAMQLAGAAACHVAMRSLIKARDRLLRKFNTDIVATASFANEDTSSSIGRSTVFLRLDVMRSNLLQSVAAAGAAVAQAVDSHQHPQQQQQLSVATA